jgi:S-adenosylmethionine/arginine decarboxylase-like enzyme
MMEGWGISTLIDLYECNPDTIRNGLLIEKYINQLADLIDMKKFGEIRLQYFGSCPKVEGFSMYQLIETSGIDGHFANESNSAYIGIFSCKDYDSMISAKFTAKFFEAKHF